VCLARACECLPPPTCLLLLSWLFPFFFPRVLLACLLCACVFPCSRGVFPVLLSLKPPDMATPSSEEGLSQFDIHERIRSILIQLFRLFLSCEIGTVYMQSHQISSLSLSLSYTHTNTPNDQVVFVRTQLTISTHSHTRNHSRPPSLPLPLLHTHRGGFWCVPNSQYPTLSLSHKQTQ